MPYTITSAKYANDEHTAAEVVTVENGAVMLSVVDRPEEWAELMSWAQTNTIAQNVNPPKAWGPLAIINALEKMGVATVILQNTPELTKAKFFAALSVPEDNPLLLSALQAVGKTIDDLKANI